MTRKRRYLISAAVLAACVGLALGVLAMLPATPGVTKANFERIEKGMTLTEVEAILGDRIEESGGGVDESISWQGPNHSFAAMVFLNNKVAGKAWLDSPETIPDKLSCWMGLAK